VTCIIQHYFLTNLFPEPDRISKYHWRHSSIPSSPDQAPVNSDHVVASHNMPRVLHPIRESIARSIVLKTTSLEERPQRKMFWNDEFDSLTDLPSESVHPPPSQKPRKQTCRTQIDAMSSPANTCSSFEGSRQAMEQRFATLANGCADGGLSDGLENVWIVACMLLLLNGVAIAIVLGLRRWRPLRGVRQEHVNTASTIVEADSKTEV
jgi:hypothetical protein